MIDDPIVEEIRQHRQAHAAKYNYDVTAIFAAVLELEKNSSRPIVNRSHNQMKENKHVPTN